MRGRIILQTQFGPERLDLLATHVWPDEVAFLGEAEVFVRQGHQRVSDRVGARATVLWQAPAVHCLSYAPELDGYSPPERQEAPRTLDQAVVLRLTQLPLGL